MELQPDPVPPCPPGDYNRDDIVNAADYVVWRDTLASSVTDLFDGADGNGDGEVTQPADYDVWYENFGNECEEPEELAVAASMDAPTIEFNGVSFAAPRSNPERNGGPVRRLPAIFNENRLDATLLHELVPNSREQAWEQFDKRRGRGWFEDNNYFDADLFDQSLEDITTLDAAFGE